jgi:hypothetical protein
MSQKALLAVKLQPFLAQLLLRQTETPGLDNLEFRPLGAKAFLLKPDSRKEKLNPATAAPSGKRVLPFLVPEW